MSDLIPIPRERLEQLQQAELLLHRKVTEEADILANSERIEWCENHQSRWGYNPDCGWSPRGVPCPKVSRLLAVPVDGEET